METIILTENEVKIIKRHLSGRYDPFFASEEDQLTFNGLIDKAKALETELDAMDERMATQDCDLLRWYYNKFQSQNGVDVANE